MIFARKLSQTIHHYSGYSIEKAFLFLVRILEYAEVKKKEAFFGDDLKELKTLSTTGCMVLATLSYEVKNG